MADMLVKLYTLPEMRPLLQQLGAQGIEIRQAHPAEKQTVVLWVRRHFQELWVAECQAALEQRPVTCYLAVERDPDHHPGPSPYDLPSERLLGFACYDVAAKGMFGPEGVREDRRGQGIGKALLLACLHAMWRDGYAYAVIGWAGPTGFYAKTVGAVPIENSEPGIFRRRLVLPTS
jgi:GNAT superfamily N-acetyltransferase